MQDYAEIINNFQALPGDELRYEFLLELGQDMKLLNSYKTPENLVQGCQSRVWITKVDGEILAASDSLLVAGLIQILLAKVKSCTRSEISDLSVQSVIGLESLRFLSFNRQIGLEAIWQKIKFYLLNDNPSN